MVPVLAVYMDQLVLSYLASLPNRYICMYMSHDMKCTSNSNKGVLGGSPTLSLKTGISSAEKTHTYIVTTLDN